VLAAFGKKTRTAARSAEGSTEGVTLKGASKVRKPRTPKSTDRVKKAVTTKRTTAPRSNQPAHETKPTPSTHRTTRPAATHRKPAPAPAPAPAPKPAVRGHRSTNGTTHVRKPHGGTKPAPAPAPIPAPGPKPAPTFDASAFVNVVNAKPLSDYVDSMRAAAGLPVDHPTFDGFRLLMSTNQPSVMAILAKAGS